MRVLINSINYHPELTGIGKYTGEMAEWLAARGFDVRVVTAPPYYPAWRVSAGYTGRRYRKEILQGVAVYRCPMWVPAAPSGSKRILHLASFAACSLPVILWQGLVWRPQLVLAVEPPLFCSPGAWVSARLGRGKAWLHVQDFEVDAAFALGILRSARLRRLVSAIERWLLRRFDRVSTLSQQMLEKLEAKGVPDPQRVLFPNWVDCATIRPLDHVSAMRKEMGIPKDARILLYSGNMGEKQGLEILIHLGKRLVGKDILMILCGDGAARSRLEDMSRGMGNIRFLPLQPIEKLNDLLNLADIHLLPQREDAADLVMPSKLTAMLASGRPVITTARAGTQVAAVVERCGRVVPPGDLGALEEAVKGLAQDAALRVRLGEAGRRYALEHWDKELVLGRFAESLSGL